MLSDASGLPNYPNAMPLHANSVPADRYLVRLNGPRTAGWQLRIPPRHPLGPLTHMFSDSIYGGSERAKEEARGMRDRMLDFDGLNAVIGTPELLATGRRYD